MIYLTTKILVIAYNGLSMSFGHGFNMVEKDLYQKYSIFK